MAWFLTTGTTVLMPYFFLNFIGKYVLSMYSFVVSNFTSGVGFTCETLSL
jgi:hypothetical protein